MSDKFHLIIGKDGRRRYREVVRDAKIGDLIVVTRGAYPFHSKGNVGKVVGFGDGTVYVDFNGFGNNYVYEDGIWYVGNKYVGNDCGEYAVLEPAILTPKEKISETDPLDLIANLAQRVAKLEREVSELRVERVAKVASVSTKSREAIVKEAKKDVEYLEFFARDRFGIRVDFVINRKKRTIVALAKAEGGDKIIRRASAKCAPNDVFNAHIGKAIAIRRLLAKAVPQEYVMAPQPSEARVGDVVRLFFNGCYAKLTKKPYALNKITERSFLAVSPSYGIRWVDDNQFEIIDDSHDGVTVEDYE